MLIETTIERGGRSLSSLSARMTQEGATMALALSAFSVPWKGPEMNELAMPEVAPPGPERRPGDADPARARPLLRALHHDAAPLRGDALRAILPSRWKPAAGWAWWSPGRSTRWRWRSSPTP